ncbi:MAG: hypothetical protein R3D26_17125 [Cyanobacteriota/Melainabacteria group bacterium]
MILEQNPHLGPASLDIIEKDLRQLRSLNLNMSDLTEADLAKLARALKLVYVENLGDPGYF